MVPPDGARADCRFPSASVAVCTGDLSAGVSEGPPITNLSVEGLTANIAPASGFAVSLIDDGQNASSPGTSGTDGGAPTVVFSGGSFGIDNSDMGINVGALGGDGAAGSGRSPAFGGTGHTGGAGGGTGDLSVSVLSGTITNSGGYGVYGLTGGGNGGAGGSIDGGVFNTIGGLGGTGGGAGKVSSTITGTTFNQNAGSIGAILLTSLAGKGGDGGFATDNAGRAKGGAGGNGGASGGASLAVGVVDIKATGGVNPGIMLISAGGDGGNGANGTSTKIANGDGGVGGAGGAASGVSLTSHGTAGLLTINTTQSFQPGIVLTSRGGSGGTGGDGNSSDADGNGGNGGAGGGAGAVNATPPPVRIETAGDIANGFLARSYGGAGGDGGVGTSARGKGGATQGGAPAGEVAVTLNGSVATKGSGSNAVVAQSVGGFEQANIFELYGASAQSGGNANTVTLSTGDGEISTGGSHAAGIVAQSIGGGGGRGLPDAGIKAVGGSGDAGGNASDVTVTNTSAVSTTGERSFGILAGAHGGGGGDAGGSYAVVAIGGSGGTGGQAGKVSVSNGAVISTTGQYSDALVATSVAGGGGAAHSVSGLAAIGGTGGSGGSAGLASVAQTAASDISTEGDDADGVLVQSVGGGGGAGSNSFALSAEFAMAVGGKGGGGGSSAGASFVEDVAGGTITTQGDRARGVFVQSVGGGGGDGGSAVSATATPAITVELGQGGNAGAGGAGGSAALTALSAVTTKGVLAPGLFAQSIGGGGGSAGTAVTTNGLPALNIAITHGGSAGDGGDGGTITLSAQDVTTAKNNSPAVVAQSVGGGGGHSGLTVSANGPLGALGVNVAIGGSAGGGGAGGAVSVSLAGTQNTGGHNADAVFAQSVGGGGGHAGKTITGSLFSGGDISVAIGGAGGNGGNGGAVSVAKSSTVETVGDLSVGVSAHSVAGGGGSSGLVYSGNAVSVGDVSVDIGRSGGAGGTSGKITIDDKAGSTTTAGRYAAALEAISIAGGGGKAHSVTSTSGLTMGAVQVDVGGKGGTGGIAGAIELTSVGDKTTTGDLSNAITASSIGGSGGHGGASVESSFTTGQFSGDASVAVGGSGGSGGTGGTVTVTNDGTIKTGGVRSYGVMAQSIGGSGGSGGAVTSANVNLSTTGGLTANVAIGGSGGSGAKGGDVSLTNTGEVSTADYFSVGLMAQSIGGNGGDGGNVFTVLGTAGGSTRFDGGAVVGGGGGTGAVGGSVTVANSGAITTDRGAAPAIYAQSIGGGGGRAGNAGSVNIDIGGSSDGSTYAGALQINVGGAGGSGNDGGTVNVTSSDSLNTGGLASSGIFAQSVGGGGGTGGTASAYSLAVNGACSVADGGYVCGAKDDSSDEVDIEASLGVVIGGNGGGGGDGQTVTIKNEGAIATSGTFSHGIHAQSIGGGGGHGGDGTFGLDAWTTNQTENNISGLIADFEAIGSFTDFSVGVGGKGGAAGDGHTVSIDGSAPISTSGDHAYGIRAQSVGGGGGSGGAGATGITGTVTVGGGGSGGGDGGAITVTQTDNVTTSGAGSVGIFAQSVGGGGGTAGDAELGFTDSWVNLNIGIGVVVTQDAGEGGSGGAVTVSTGAINTTGEAAHGVVAQSVGGSGGMRGSMGQSAISGLAGSAGAPGNAGLVTVTNSGPITVSGAKAHGIFAQSVSGTGDGVQSEGVTLHVNADIAATGEGGRAILAQVATPKSGGSPGPINITVAQDATVSTGASGFETIGVKGPGLNTITNSGTITQANPTGYAIRAEDGITLVDNSGTLTGSVLMDGDSVVQNGVAAVFNTGTTVTVGSALENYGVLNPLGVGTVGTTTVTAPTFTQARSGSLGIDLDLSRSVADKLVIKAATANSISGLVTPHVVAGTPSSGSKGSFEIVSTSGATLQASGLTVNNAGAVDYSLTEGTSSVTLGYTVDYGLLGGEREVAARAVGATANHAEFGGHIDKLISARAAELATGGTSFSFVDDLVLFLLNTQSLADLVDVYGRFAPGEVFSVTDGGFIASQRFADTLQSCPAFVSGVEGVSDGEGSCAWSRLSGTWTTRERDGLTSAYDESAFGLTAGAQVRLLDDWIVGGAIAYENVSTDADAFDADGDRLFIGAVVKRLIGATTLSASASGGTQWNETRRTVRAPGGPYTARGEPQDTWLSGHVRVAHTFGIAEGLTVEPHVDLGLTQEWSDGYTERGAGPFGLVVGDSAETYATVNPALTALTKLRIFDVPAEASARIGAVAVLGDVRRHSTLRLTGVPVGGPTFTVEDEGDRVFADLGLAITAQFSDKISAEGRFDALLSNNQRSLAGAARLNIHF